MAHPLRTRLSVAPLLMLAGCCTALDALPVTNTAGAPASTVALVEEGIAQFAAWTGREQVCVPGIEILDEVPDTLFLEAEDGAARGRYAGRGEPIRVEARWSDIDAIVRHELCHALDADEGIVANNPSAFAGVPAGDGSQDDAEVFAYACADGPRPVGLLQALEACGAGSAVGDLLMERVFTGHVDAPVRVAGAPTLREVWRPTDDWSPLLARVVGDELWLLGVNSDWTEVGFRRIDPATGAVLAEAPMYYTGGSDVSLVPADDTLRFTSAEGAVAWDGTAWIASPLPGSADAVDPVVADGRVWFTDAERTALYAATLPDGEPEAVPGIVPAEDWAWAASPLVAAVDVEGAPAVARLGDAWTVRDLPDGLVGSPGGGSDDGTVATWEELYVSELAEELALPDLAADEAGARIGVLLVHGADGTTDASVDCTGEGEVEPVRLGGRVWALNGGALHEVVLGD